LNLPISITAILTMMAPAVWPQSFEAPVVNDPNSFASAPITASGRASWALDSTFGPTALLTTSVESGFKTWMGVPKEYGTHWDGYGKRVASGFSTSLLSNTMEASIGSLWGEDPRYHRRGTGSAGSRFGYAIKMAFLAENRSGEVRPAYARFTAIPTSRLISDSWRQPSELTVGGNTMRISLAFAKKIGGNAFSEFWPDLRRQLGLRNAAAASKSNND